MKNRIVRNMIIILSITLLFGVISLSYAYFSLEVEGKSKEIVLTTGDLRLKYTDISVLNLENAMPGDSVNKILIVENIGTEDTSYNIVWKDLINQINYFDLHLDMKCKSYKNYGKSNQEEYGECKSFYKAVPYTETKIKKDIKRDIEIEVGVTQVYELTITFLNRNYSQDENLNRSFSGRIELEDYIDNSPEAIYCNYDGEMVQGAEYINGQYTYRYMQEYNNSTSGYNWTNIKDNGWGVVLTDKESTEPVTSKLCTYINNIPVVSMLNMFSESQTSSIDLSSFDTSNVVYMNHMFKETKMTEINLENFNTKNVKSIAGMFQNSNIENLDLSNFDISNVSTAYYTFWESKAKYIDVSSFDTSKFTTMMGMFWSTVVDMIDLSHFNTSNVTNMQGTFLSGKFKLIDLSSFDTSKVIDMNRLFSAHTYIYGYEKLNTGQATDMGGMFTGVLNENLDLSSFDTSKVTDMKEMFSSVKTKNINVSSFNTSNVTDMSRMFAWNDNIMLDLRSFDLNDNVDLTGMFTNSKSIIGYAKNETIVSKFNDSSVTGIPSTLKFIVKQN
ncbi:DUF285 domain-containing protein [Holdemanella sp. SCCA2]|nr:DUF285 domain-containing protein [Holdemanella sp. SCCA2]